MPDFITPPINEQELQGWYQELCRLVNRTSWIMGGSYIYDFSVHGGAIGSINLGGLPNNCIIVRAWYRVVTAFTSGGAATVAFGVASDDATGLKTATAYNHADYGAGYHDFTPDGTAANFTTKTTALRKVVMTIAGATLTAGKVRVWYEYIISSD